MTYKEPMSVSFVIFLSSLFSFLLYNSYFRTLMTQSVLFNNLHLFVMLSRKNMYAGGDSAQMNGDTPHSGGHGGGGHAVGDELKRTGK